MNHAEGREVKRKGMMLTDLTVGDEMVGDARVGEVSRKWGGQTGKVAGARQSWKVQRTGRCRTARSWSLGLGPKLYTRRRRLEDSICCRVSEVFFTSNAPPSSRNISAVSDKNTGK